MLTFRDFVEAFVFVITAGISILGIVVGVAAGAYWIAGLL